jgi:antitoxin PrlF
MDQRNFVCSKSPCCQVEAIVTVDQRGQMVLSKEIREKANIRAGDKLALISWGNNNEVDYIFLIKSENLYQSVQKVINISPKETIK